MKKLYLNLLALAITATSIQAQITLKQSTHGIVPGETHYFVFAKGLDEGAAGTDITWDFSKLTPTGTTLTSKMLNASETPKGTEIVSANVVIEEFGNNFYFSDTRKSVLDYGVANAGYITKYDKPAVKLDFPLYYGKKVSGDFSGTQTANGTSVAITGTYSVEADAYGSLILPDGVTLSNTLRVKQTRSYNGSACKEITYRWYVSYLHYPVLVVIKSADGAGKETATLVAYHPGADRLKSLEAEKLEVAAATSSVNVFPNPWKADLNIEYTLESDQTVQIELYDVNGKLVKVLQQATAQPKGKNALTISEVVKNGVYFVKIVHGNQAWVNKVVKQ
jgi:hypothetical protein